MTTAPTPTLGVLGGGGVVSDVVRAARDRGWRILTATDAADGRPGEVPWTTLLDSEACAAVVVGAGGWNAGRGDAVRALVQAGRPLVLAQPLELSMLWAFELDMIARDSGARIVPALPDRLHPSVAALKAAVAAARTRGGGESLRLDRTLADRSRESVLAAFSRDVDLVRALIGDPARVTTLGAGDPESAWATLAVGLSGPDSVPARWQVATGGPPGLRVRLEHADGSVEVFAPDGPEPWTAAPPLAPAAPFDRGGTIVDLLESAVGRRGPPSTAIPAASWTDAARALEITEAVPRSLARGRAIDLHGEEFSELGTFKGTMASLGCGIVLVALLLVVGATLVAGVSRELGWGFGTAVANAWPAVVLAALLGFLGLQALPLIVATDRPRRHD